LLVRRFRPRSETDAGGGPARNNTQLRL